MAEGLPTPKSREQIVSEMLQEYVGLTGINDLNTGSVITQFFDVVARSIARTSGDIFQILRDFSIDRARGEALNRLGDEERVPRNTAQVATGTVEISDTSFEKIETKIYAGTSAPNIGEVTIKVSDASLFTATGTIYIGRGTPNIEGPISYGSVAQVGDFWEITLTSPTTKFHNISESIILGQGGTRNVPVGTVVASIGAGATADINYTVSASALLLDGENINSNVQVVAQIPGSAGNAPVGGINQINSPPFTNAKVTNKTPLTTGSDTELDDDYRDRIKKARLTKSLGTALAVKNAVLGIQAPDENARVTSTEIDTSNPDLTILYLDNGEGYEGISEGVGLEFVVDSAIGGEQTFQLATGGNQTSIPKAFLESALTSPFVINGTDKLSILVGGIISEHVFAISDFQATDSATSFEIVASINDNSDLTFEATTSESGSKVVIRAKAENDEFLQLSTPSSGVDAGPKLGFTNNEVATVLLYKNRELLNKNGRSAFILTKEQFNWNNTITSGDTLIVSIDKTASITYIFTDSDFLSEGQHSTVAAQNTLSSWVNVINTKVTGVTAEINGEKIKLTSNLGSINRASVNLDITSTLVVKGMFDSLDLTADGNEADFIMSRNTAQIKLNTPLKVGDSLNLGSEFTRAELQGGVILGGTTTISTTAYFWLMVDDENATSVNIGVSGDTFLDVTKPGSGIIRYISTSSTAFSNVNVGDYVVIWSDELLATSRLEGRVNAVTNTTLDLKVTVAEESAAVVESTVLFSEGFTVIRSKYVPQKIKIDAGTYDINTIATIIDDQTENATVTIDNNDKFVIRTNTESITGALFLVDINSGAKPLGLIKNAKSQSINSQIATYESQITDKQFPLFIHGKITSDAFADTPNAYINSITSSEDMDALGFDNTGFLCSAQPYGSIQDVSSTECMEIEKITGTVVTLENSPFYRRSRVNDRYFLTSGYDFGSNDSVVVVLDNNPTGKTFEMPLHRTALTNNSYTVDTINFRAKDVEGGTVEFSQLFSSSFAFDNYKVLMQAKNVIDPSGSVSEDAILYRSIEWGSSGEKNEVGYFYPTSANAPLTHIVSVNESVEVKIFLKSGIAINTTIDGTTEWNVTTSPAGGYDNVTYTYSGTGTTPGLVSVSSGDYVSIVNTGEFDLANLGGYRVDSADATSFTIRRETGSAVVESNIASVDVNVINFFEKSDTTAQEIVDYVTSNLSDYITATIISDGGLNDGSGVISRSTGEDSNFANTTVFLKDGNNFLLSSNITAGGGVPQFVLKNTLDLPFFTTNTTNAYTFNNGETLKFVPITSIQVTKLLNTLAVTGYSTLGDIKSTERNNKIQITTDILGADGAVQIAGGEGTSSIALIEGSATNIGSQDNSSMIVSILTASASGFHSDQWVKLSSTNKQQKLTFVNELISAETTTSTPSVGFSKIQLSGKTIGQRMFGRDRCFTRTRGRTFKVEKQGQFSCISWNEVGTQPFFLQNNIDIDDGSSSTATLLKDSVLGTVDILVETGNMKFDAVDLGDLITITNMTNTVNNGSFKVIGISNDAKTIRISNPNGSSELLQGTFTINTNADVAGDVFTIGGSTITEGVDFTIGGTDVDTASNLAAAIALLPNTTATSLLAVVTVISQITGVTIATSVSGSPAGASAGQANLIAPTISTGDFVVKSEVEEGDNVSINSDFNVLNQGLYRVIRRFNNSIYIDNANIVEEEVTLASNLITLNSDATTDYDIVKSNGLNRISWGGAGLQPSLSNARPGDVITLGTDFAASNRGSFHVIGSGTTFVDYINVKGTSESGVIITDVFEIHVEAMKFKTYDGTSIGDDFVISDEILGATNAGSYVITDVLSENEIIVSGTLTSEGPTVLGSDFNKIYVQEKNAYVGYKKIDLIATNPSNISHKSLVFDTQNQSQKITELSIVTLSAIGKLNFPNNITRGVDSYRYHTGLIGEANRVVYGDPRSSSTHEGVAATGASVFIKAPLVKRIKVSIGVRLKTGTPFSTITEEIRNAVAALINSNDIGVSIPISDIVTVVGTIGGVQATSIISPNYNAQNDTIKINSGEKARVVDIIADILISKVE